MTDLVIKLPDWVQFKHFPILGLDPGKTIGWALLNGHVYDKQEPHIWHIDLQTDRLTWPAEALRLSVLINGVSTVVAEDFLLFADKAQSQSWGRFPAARVLGFVEGHIQTINDWMMPTLRMITPAQNKQITNEFLKEKFGANVPRNRHARDALRVIVAWLLQKEKK